MINASQVKTALAKLVKPGKKEILSRFFKTGPGQYGQGDVFIGVMVPKQRSVAKQFKNLPLAEIAKLLTSPVHEHRLTALLILVDKFQAAVASEQKKIVKFYLSQTKLINNWDLVDLSADKILGAWLVNKDRRILNKLSKSKNFWERRIAMISTFAFIKAGQTQDTWRLARTLLKDRHDLMHKASGWMLREAGQRDLPGLKKFLNEHKHKMPRTMLRYAIEKFSEAERKKYLKI